jgi:HTH-type transcriptional regulator / antitoxin HigA
MKIKPIRTEADHDAAPRTIEKYFDRPPRKGTPDADRFDGLATLIEAYERKRWPIDPPSPVDAILYRMETAGYTQGDLARLLDFARVRSAEPQASTDPGDDPQAQPGMEHPGGLSAPHRGSSRGIGAHAHTFLGHRSSRRRVAARPVR